MNKTLSDIAEYVTSKIECSVLTKNTYVGMDNLVPNRGGIVASEYVPQEGTTTEYKKGDVLLGNIRPYFKKIWLATNDGGCSPDVLCIRAKKGVSPLLLYAILSQDSFFGFDVKGAKGSKMPRGDRDHIMTFPIQDVDNAEDLGTFINNIQKKIINNNSICSDLESMAKTLYDYWFVQFDFPDENGKPYKSSGGKTVWNKELKREIPEGWEVKDLSECITTIIDRRGVTPKKLGGEWVEKGIIALSAKVVKNGHLLDLSEANQVSEDMYKRWMPTPLQNGDILMTSEAPLGEFYYMYGDPAYCLSQRLFAIRASESISSAYLYYELSRGNGYSQIMGKASGSTVFGIRQDELRRVKILLPSHKIMVEFEKKIIKMIAKSHLIIEENRELTSLRDFLLPMLMNGQMKIKEAE